MAKGVPMLGVVTKKCKIVQEGATTFRIVLVQGLNRQIRRMCEYFGYEVTKLERVRIMNITLKGLPVGDWRQLTDQELEEIYKQVADSKDEAVVKPKSKPKSGGGKKGSLRPLNERSGSPRSDPRTATASARGPKSGGSRSAGPSAGGPRSGAPKSGAGRSEGPRKASGKSSRPGASAGSKYSGKPSRSSEGGRGAKGKSSGSGGGGRKPGRR
jgi:23S rRNA pseudouridine2604 synthase